MRMQERMHITKQAHMGGARHQKFEPQGQQWVETTVWLMCKFNPLQRLQEYVDAVAEREVSVHRTLLTAHRTKPDVDVPVLQTM